MFSLCLAHCSSSLRMGQISGLENIGYDFVKYIYKKMFSGKKLKSTKPIEVLNVPNSFKTFYKRCRNMVHLKGKLCSTVDIVVILLAHF